MSARLLVGVDVGSTGIKAVVLDSLGAIRAEADRETPVRTKGAQTEFPVRDLTAATWSAIAEAVRESGGVEQVAGIAVASVGESFVPMDAAGEPLDDIIAWYDPRAAEEAREVVRRIGDRALFAITGLDIAPIYTLCKLLWLRRHRPGVMAEARRIALMADWIAFTLCGRLATDISLAARTLLASPANGDWSDRILDAFGFDRAFLPPIRPSGTPLGPVGAEARRRLGLPEDCIVSVGGHDHILSSFAAGAADQSRVVASAGTAEAILRTGTRLVEGWPEDDPYFAQGAIRWAGDPALHVYVIGSMFDSGGAMARFREGACPEMGWPELVAAAERAEPLSAVFLSDRGLHLHHDPRAWVDAVFERPSGAVGDRFRAVVEGLALESVERSDALTEHAALTPVEEVRLVGGLARNRLYVALKAAAFERPVRVSDFLQFTALGAAIAAGLGAGIYASLDNALTKIGLGWTTVAPEPTLVAAMRRLRSIRADGRPRARPFEHQID